MTSFNRAPNTQSPLAKAVAVVHPAHFGANPETAETNHFQSAGKQEYAANHVAQREFEALVDRLGAAGVEVIVFEDSPNPIKPDAIFPNNWFSTHADGRVVLYPMLAPSRRRERNPAYIDELASRYGRGITCVIDLSPWERLDLALEGTGSLVLDRATSTAYACISARTNLRPLKQWASIMNYRVVSFHARDDNGLAIYHTNVMMSVGKDFAVVALDSVADAGERALLQASLEDTGHEMILISQDQVANFAGNILHLMSDRGPVIALSKSAFDAFDGSAIRKLEKYGELIPIAIPVIEQFGGGSVRCMLSEIYLPSVTNSGKA